MPATAAEPAAGLVIVVAAVLVDTNGRVVTAGGRVLSVTALGESIPAAKLYAYRGVKQIRWEGAWCRKDISDKARRIAEHSA